MLTHFQTSNNMIPQSIQLFTNQSVKHKNGEVYKVKKDYGSIVCVFMGTSIKVLPKKKLSIICESIYQ